MNFIKWFKDLNLKDIPLVGGKNAALGQMISQLEPKGIKIPNGFAITSDAYWYFLEKNKLIPEIKNILDSKLKYKNPAELNLISHKIRNLIEQGTIPIELQKEIILNYEKLSSLYGQNYCDIAIRSSATAEDLPEASFAGQQESFLNKKGVDQLLESYKKCISSLFTARAIYYRIEKNFDHYKIALSVGVQKMIRSDLACSGVAFTLDPESGFKNVIFINSSYGLGESIVLGKVEPDSFYVFKPTLEMNFKPILKKELGSKETKIIYSENESTISVAVPLNERSKFSLNNEEILDLANMSLIIEKNFSELNEKWTPMDIEWAKDGQDGKIYIVQARNETIHSNKKQKNYLTKYLLKETDTDKLNKLLLLTGQSIGQQITTGIAKVVKNLNQIGEINEGDILVTTMTDPDWVPIMKKASGIVTEQGGRTCHAAIVSRELGIPAIIGTKTATETIKSGTEITLDCSQGLLGYVYQGKISYEIKKTEISNLKKLPVNLMLNCGSPDQAFTQSFLPVDGVGLARTEFIISNSIKIHPMALINFDKISDEQIKKQIENITNAYPSKTEFFIDKLAEQAGTIAAAFYPKPVIIRFSDFKSNEYRNLIGGSYFEPKEENPMIGLRGASRYYNPLYKNAFRLECEAIKKIRFQMGLTNVNVMLPFVRTIEEAKKIINLLTEFGIKKDKVKDKDNFEIIMMCEVPSNSILISEFSKIFDGFSIGSNDLTQLTLAIDRDSVFLSDLFNEQDESVKIMIKMAIDGAKKNNKPIGICGQGPSDFPEFAKFLIENGITSISLNADSVLPFLTNYYL